MEMARQEPGYGLVLVSDEVLELVDDVYIQRAIEHLRFAGGEWPVCDERISPTHDVSLVLDHASTAKMGVFIHAEHGPPQVREFRRDRRVSLALAERARERATDVNGFTSIRGYPSPKALLTISPAAIIGGLDDDDTFVNPWFEKWRSHGMRPVDPPYIDAVPRWSIGWSVTLAPDGTIAAYIGENVLFEGELPLPRGWARAIEEEGRCVVVAAAVGVVSDEHEYRSGHVLDALAAAGDLIGVTATARTVDMLHAFPTSSYRRTGAPVAGGREVTVARELLE